MNRLDAFLEELRRALEPVPGPIADEAVRYYADYFADARQAGISEDEVLRRTGTVEQIASAIKDDLAVTAAETRLGPMRLLRLSRRFLGRSGREGRKPRLVGAGRAARGTSLAVVSLLPLSMAIILYLAAFAILAGTVALVIVLVLNITGHPDLTASDRAGQIGLMIGLGALGLLLALLAQRAGHAFSRMTLALFRRVASHPRPVMARPISVEPIAPTGPDEPAPTGALEPDRAARSGPFTEPLSVPVAPSGSMDNRIPSAPVTAAQSPAASSVSTARPASSSVAAFARETTTERATAAMAGRKRRGQAFWRFSLIALLVIALSGFTLSAFHGLPQTYFRLWNSQRPNGIETINQGIGDSAARKVVIRTLNTDIIVEPSSSKNIQYRYEPLPYVLLEESRVFVDSAGNVELTLQERSNGRLPLFELLSAHKGTTALTVRLPVNPDLELQVQSNGGDIVVQVPGRRIDARAGSGDIRIHGRQQAAGDQAYSARGTVTWFS